MSPTIIENRQLITMDPDCLSITEDLIDGIRVVVSEVLTVSNDDGQSSAWKVEVVFVLIPAPDVGVDPGE